MVRCSFVYAMRQGMTKFLAIRSTAIGLKIDFYQEFHCFIVPPLYSDTLRCGCWYSIVNSSEEQTLYAGESAV